MILNKRKFSEIDEKTLEKAMNLFNSIPFSVLEHYSKKSKIDAFDLCADVVTKNHEWYMRLTNPSTFATHQDIIHDFVGLANFDEHFVPRI